MSGYNFKKKMHFFLKTFLPELTVKERIFSLVDMITNTKFSNCLNVFKIGLVLQ